jgi:hypothetical protein
MSRMNHQKPCTGRAPAGPLPDGSRIRVMQLLATGTNGGAQESLVNTVLAREHGEATRTSQDSR